MKPVYIISGVRTAIGDFGGALKDIPPAKLGSLVIAEAVKRGGLSPDAVQHVVMGNVIPSEPKTLIWHAWRRSTRVCRSRRQP